MDNSNQDGHMIPEIGQAWTRGEHYMEIVDISETRVWVAMRYGTSAGEFKFQERDKWPELIKKTMAVEGTKFIPANAQSDLSPAQTDNRNTKDSLAGD